MILIDRQATITNTIATTITTISATTAASRTRPAGSMHHERGRAPDLDDLDLVARVEHLAVVVCPRRPDLAADLDRPDALAVRDPLEHHRGLPDQRRAAGPQSRPRVAVAHRDRAQQREEDDPGREERDGGDEPARAGGRERGRDRPARREGRQVERVRVKLTGGERRRDDEPQDP